MITDGVTSVPDVAVCETLLNQLRSGTVACSFVQVRTFQERGVGMGQLTKSGMASHLLQVRVKMVTCFLGRRCQV